MSWGGQKMETRFSKVVALAAGMALMLAVQAHGQTSDAIITVGSTSGMIGETGLSIPVMVNTGVAGTMIAGTQNNITFSGGVGAAVSIAAKSNGKPDCAVNDAINKGGTSFAFQPAGCTGETCTAVKALVLALDNVCPICGTSTTDCPGLPACPVTMYTCNVTINSTAAMMDYPLTCSDAGASDPSGGSLTTSCTDGMISVTTGGPTPTPTAGGTDQAIITIGSTSGMIGQPGLSIPVMVNTGVAGTQIAGTQNNITFSGGIGAAVSIAAKSNGKPDCTVNDAINKGGTSFAFQPAGCTGEMCTAVKALVLALDNVCPICGTSTTDCPGLPACPVTMYTCNVTINSTAAMMDYPLTCSDAGASDPAGGSLTTSCTDGKITVSSGGGGTPTPTPTTGGATPTATHTGGAVGTPTATHTGGGHTPTRTRVIGPTFPRQDDDACAIVSPSTSGTGWMLFLPAAALLWFRRRSR
jgi:hypothetical protein